MENIIKKSSVLVIGDVILDKYWFGKVDRISPEAPIPIIHKDREEFRLGGAANVAYNLKKIGAKSEIISFIGDDENGNVLKDLLLNKGVKPRLFREKNFKTISKLRVLRNTHQLLRVDEEDENPKLDHDKILSLIKKNIDKYKAIVISDYGKGALSPKLIKDVIKISNRKKIKVLVDPKGSEFYKYKKAFIITPNLSEFEGIVGKTSSIEDRIKKAKLLRKELDLNYLLLTMGKEGMLIIGEKYSQHFKAEAKNVFDVSGAGDTVISVLAAFLSVDFPINESVKFSNFAAAIVVGKVGTSSVSMSELKCLIRDTEDKNLITQKELINIIENERSNKKKIIMTNGCFDILHSGHLAYLKEARSLGDILIVAINSDSSVSRLKGRDRPINTSKDRAKLLNALEFVDYVIEFKEDTPKKLYSYILPDIIVKGGDYSISEIEGALEVKKNGGEVKVLKFIEGYSSSGIISRIKN